MDIGIAMSTVTVDIPDDVEDELDEFLESHPEYDDREDLLVAFARVMLDAEASIGDVGQTPPEGDGQAVEASRDALASLLDFFGVPRQVSEETLERIERSRGQFDRGEFVALEDV